MGRVRISGIPEFLRISRASIVCHYFLLCIASRIIVIIVLTHFSDLGLLTGLRDIIVVIILRFYCNS